MILVTHPEKPFSYTAKNTPRRHAIIKAYEDEIESLYQTGNQALLEVEAPSSWTYDNVLNFIRMIVSGVLVGEITDDDDIFQHGCDRSVLVFLCIFVSELKRGEFKAYRRPGSATQCFEH